ncbi:nucleic acid-binding protein [Linderina pennispora]|uniref:Nucleic acid-binding protein n=1 Tax=Linderina pennispora TaxID=61395 RepID=A0A1Y1W6L7_9FUNG|nr:nucleic acid-binding protein [Linderina pennispora]ORX69197.1 nucleic acid-binding protein [Linderina pennispora]
MPFRFYEAEFPEPEDVVMVKVIGIGEVGANVQLEEYGNIEGMILLSELSRRRIRSVQKLVRVGKREAVVVLRVDKEKGYIDLSKRQATPEDAARCEEKFQKSKAVHSIINHVANKLDLDIEELYQKFGWPLYKKYGHAYDAFKLAITNPEAVLGDLGIEQNVLDELLPVKIRADIEVNCFGYQGVEAIRKALKAAEALSQDDAQIKIRLIAPPMYVMSTNSVNKAKDIELMEKAIAEADRVIKEEGGELVVRMKPKAVSEHEEKELEDFMARAERENAEVSGDDYSSGGEE